MSSTQPDRTTGLDRKKSPGVVFSILNWRGWRDTMDGLESVRRLRYPNYLTVVVDNGSGDERMEKLRAGAKVHFQEADAFVEYCREAAPAGGDAAREEGLERCASGGGLVAIDKAENLGLTGGDNVAIQYPLRRRQSAHYLLLLNKDAPAEGDCLARLLEAGQASGTSGWRNGRRKSRPQAAGSSPSGSGANPPSSPELLRSL